MAKMSDEDRDLIHTVVYQANGAGCDYDIKVEAIGVDRGSITVRTINEDGGIDCTAFVRVLGIFKVATIEATLLGVDLDGDGEWRIIDARGTSLFALLYC